MPGPWITMPGPWITMSGPCSTVSLATIERIDTGSEAPSGLSTHAELNASTEARTKILRMNPNPTSMSDRSDTIGSKKNIVYARFIVFLWDMLRPCRTYA